MKCRVCGGPLKPLMDRRQSPPQPVKGFWLHDNSGSWYAGMELTHDPIAEEESP